jgi:hypothetical protein
MNNDGGATGELILGIVLFVFVEFIIAALGYGCGRDSGYIECLDDMRLGKTPRYKLVQTAEKWVEVKE